MIFHFCRVLVSKGEAANDVANFYKVNRRNLDGLGWTEFRVMVESGKALVDNPIGAGPLRDFIEQARTRPLPACGERYPEEEVRTLVCLCQLLQERSGEHPFVLAGAPLGEEMQVSQPKAARWLKALCMDGVIELVGKRGLPGRASKYRYIGGSP